MKNYIYQIKKSNLKHISKVLKAIAHPIRLQILQLLSTKTLSVQEIVKKVHTNQAVVSQHLKIMREGMVVSTNRDKNKIYYSLAHSGLKKLIDCLAKCQDKCSLKQKGK